MRQYGDSQFIDFLNNVRIENIKPYDMESRIAQPEQNKYSDGALHIFAENVNGKIHNQGMLQSINRITHIVTAIDQLPMNVSHQKTNEVLNRNQSQIDGLEQTLKIKTGARIMLTVNIDLQDRQ